MGGVKMAIELIDTLWNVNDEDYEFLQEQYEN